MAENNSKKLSDRELKESLEKILVDFEMKAKKIVSDFEADLRTIKNNKY
jgi:hypothetical protein